MQPFQGTMYLRQFLGKVDKFPYGGKGIDIAAGLRRGRTQHVAEHRCMAHLLRGHEGDEVPVLGGEAGFFKFLWAETFEHIVEEIELNVLLINSQCLEHHQQAICFMVHDENQQCSQSQSPT